MTTLVWRTDLHLADQAPSSRKDDWAATLLDKIGQTGQIARDCEASAIIDGGDFFHVKSPGRNSHALVRRVAEIHATFPCPTYVNVGNHDCVHGNYDYLHQQPLGVLFATGVFNRLYDEHEAEIWSGGLEDPVVRVVGIPYHGTSYDLERFKIERKGSEDFLVVAAHVLASPRGGSMFEGEDIVKYADLPKLAPDVDVWCFGHWHKNQGITCIRKAEDGVRPVHVVNVGSMTRGALVQDNLQRIPEAVVMKFTKEDGVLFRQVPLTVQPAMDVFDVESRARQEARESHVEAYVEKLRTSLAPASDGALADEIRSMADVPDAVREQALHYLEQAGVR